MNRLCATCGKPLNRGGAASLSNARCVVCRVADQMRGFRYAGADVDYGEMGAPDEAPAPRYGIRNPARNRRIAELVMSGEHPGDVALRFNLARETVLTIVREARRG